MKATLSSSLMPDAHFFINRVVGTSIFLGYVSGGIQSRANLSAYASGTVTIHIAEQPKRLLDDGAIDQYTYEQDPVNARRVVPVDDQGNIMGTPGNPMTVDAEVIVDNLQLFNKPYDTGATTYPSSTQEVYTTYVGGLTGTPVQQVTINYTDATKNNLLNWQRANWNGSSWVVG
jgi:hypothetical protein